MDSIIGLAEGIAGEFQRHLPRQRKTQRTNLSLLVATMLEVRSANLMDLAAGLPRDADRIDMLTVPPRRRPHRHALSDRIDMRYQTASTCAINGYRGC